MLLFQKKMNSAVDPFCTIRVNILGRLCVLVFFLRFKSVMNNKPGLIPVDPKSRVLSPIRTAEEIEESLRHHLIIPEVIDYAPKHMLWMEFIDDFIADIGNDLSGLDVLYPPWLIKWPVENSSYYAILGTSPDTIVDGVKVKHEFLHWLVVNIPGERVADGRAILAGKILADYVGPEPPKNGGYHRYAFFAYKQNLGKTKYSITKLNASRTDPLRQFVSKEFVKKMHFGKAVATNFFCVEWRVNPFRPFA